MRAAFVALVWALGTVTMAGGPPASPRAMPEAAGQTSVPPVVCGFRNPGYTGLCEEKTPYVKGKELKDHCNPILDCLNNPQCIKTYCGSTTIRQGWALESAKRAKST